MCIRDSYQPFLDKCNRDYTNKDHILAVGESESKTLTLTWNDSFDFQLDHWDYGYVQFKVTHGPHTPAAVSYTHLDVYKRQADDGMVPVEISRRMKLALEAAGEVRDRDFFYTEYPAELHYNHFCWGAAYGDPSLRRWLLAQRQG